MRDNRPTHDRSGQKITVNRATLLTAAALLFALTALAAPVLGAIADATGPRKPWIAAFSVLAVLGSRALWIVPPAWP